MGIRSELIWACKGFRNALEDDFFPKRVGDKFNVIEGMGALWYQPCIYSLSKVIRVFEKNDGAWWAQIAQQVASLAMVALTSVIAGAGFVAKRIGSLIPHDRTVRTDEVLGCKGKDMVDDLYDMMQGFSEAAEEIGLDYRMEGGTALGAVRQHGLIRWDDDGDFNIMESEKAKVEQAIKDGVFAKRGLEVHFQPSIQNYQIRFSEEESRRREEERKAREEACKGSGEEYKRDEHPQHAHIDLFLMERVETIENNKPETHIRYSSTFCAEHYHHFYFTPEEWDNPVDWKFGPGEKITLKGVSKEAMNRYLKRGYGDDCLTCGLATHSHAEISLFGFTLSGLGLPTVLSEKVKIVDFNPAYGWEWK
jgi:hypothetical protein